MFTLSDFFFAALFSLRSAVEKMSVRDESKLLFDLPILQVEHRELFQSFAYCLVCFPRKGTHSRIRIQMTARL